MARPSGKPGRDCPRCPRLVAFRGAWREREPDCQRTRPLVHPARAPADRRPRPGLRGANRTGRPFTGDYAGDLLYATHKEFGFVRGSYEASPDDRLTLIDCRITNAVRCVPPENKPTPDEIATCRSFLAATIKEMSRLRAIVALGRVAHDTFIAAQEARRADYPFSHGSAQTIGAIKLFDSYHCSRLNTNTGVLTPRMFRDVFARVRRHLDVG
jgi:uracil-DNA glycosylase family 4